MRFLDHTSQMLDVIGEMPPPVKQEVDKYIGLIVFGHKTGSTLCICKDKKVGEKMLADSKRYTYGSNLNKQFDSK